MPTLRKSKPAMVSITRFYHLRKLTMSSITTPPTRKRQKKADSRVAELERKIDALTATLHAQKGGPQDVRHHGGIPEYDNTTPAMAQPEGAYRFGSISHDWSSRYPDPPPGYGPAQNMQGPEPKRRKLGDGDRHAVSDPEAIVSPPST